MVLVDTNVVVSLWIDNDWTERARELLRLDPHWRTEAVALIEFTNVMATYIRMGLAREAESLIRLAEAESLFGSTLVVVEHRQALLAAVRHRVSAYDARFLAASASLGLKLTTEDAKLRRAAPRLTQALDEAMAA